ncbi:MAG: aldo/keto reductase [Clostridia bacterium]
MKKIILGKTGLEITPIFYGGIVSMNDGQENSDKYVEYAIKKGINYFDIAPSYGDAQEKLGNSLVPYRKEIFLACKTMKRGLEEGKAEFEKSIEMLHTDHFDVYQMHSLFNVEDLENAMKDDGIFNFMLKMKEEGVVKNLGVTCHSEEAAVRALELYDFDTVLFPLNWGLDMAKGFGSKISEKAKEKNVGLLGMKSMIHRAWIDQDEKAGSRFPKSWCKPFCDQDELCIAAMKYSMQKLGAKALVPPGNIESFTFAVENIDKILEPLTDKDMALLKSELANIDGHYFF